MTSPAEALAAQVADLDAYLETQKFGPNMENGGYACDNCGGVEHPSKDWAAWPAHASDCTVGKLAESLRLVRQTWTAATEAAAQSSKYIAAAYWLDYSTGLMLNRPVPNLEEHIAASIRTLPSPFAAPKT